MGPTSVSTSAGVVARLLGERLEDGGWNCERVNGSVRSSFATTINVLEGLESRGGTPVSQEARRSGEEYLLERHLFVGSAPESQQTSGSWS